MLKKITIFFAVVITAIILTGCPAVLESGLSSDIMITLGLIRPAEGTASILTAVGGTMNVPVMISDLNRNSAAGSYEVTFTLDTDGDLSTTGDNVAAGTATVDAGAETVVELSVPTAITDADVGTYNLFAYFEAAAGDPGTRIGDTVYNIGVVQVVIDTEANNLPDLEIAFVNPPSTYRAPEATFPITFKVTNTGNAKLASGTSIVVGFSVDINGTPTDVAADVTITLAADLLPNDFVTGSATITMPTLTQMALDDGVAEADVDSWTGTLDGTVDPDNAITEIVEGGTDTFGLNSGTLQPDLDILSIDLPDPSVVEGPVEVSVTVRNIGYAAADAGTYGLILFNDVNTDGAYDSGDTVIHQWEAADSPAVPWDVDGSGDGNFVAFNGISVEGLVFPASMTAGNHDIGAVITGDLTEWSTANNVDTTTVSFIAADVDLEITRMTTTYREVVGTAETTVPVSLTIKNSGGETLTTDFTIEFYISDDNNLGAGDTLVGSESVTADLVPNIGRTLSVNTTIPAATTGGFYTMYALLDSADAVAELNENNNQQSNANNCSVFIAVDDDTNDIDARLMFCYPDGEPNDSYSYLQYFYFWNDTSSWTSGNSDQDITDWIYNSDSIPKVLTTLNVTIAQATTHGVRTRATANNTVLTWRLVPDYVSSIQDQYIPAALSTDDAYEDNDSTATATALSGTAHPLSSWVSSYDSDSYDDDYFTFDF